MSVIDASGILSFYQFQIAGTSNDPGSPEMPSAGEHLPFERKVSHPEYVHIMPHADLLAASSNALTAMGCN